MLKNFVAFVLITSLSLGHVAQALTIQDSSVAKKYPEKSDLIINYWEKFRRAMVVGSDSGDFLAAQVLLGEAEEALRDSGVSDSELDALRAFSGQVLEEEKTQAKLKVTLDEGVALAELIETLPLPVFESKLQEFISAQKKENKDYFQGQFENIKQHKFRLSNDAITGDVTYRLSLQYLLFTILEADGADFSKKIYQRGVDAFLNVLTSYVTKASFANGIWLVLSDRPTQFGDVLLKRWVELHPRYKKWFDPGMIVSIIRTIPDVVTHNIASAFLFGFLPLDVFYQTYGYVSQSRPFDERLYAAWAAVGMLWGIVWVGQYYKGVLFKNESAIKIDNAVRRVLGECRERMSGIKRR